MDRQKRKGRRNEADGPEGKEPAMQKNDFTVIDLAKGQVRVYERDGVRLHAYQTRDLIDDEVFVVEKDGRGLVIEYPPFFENIAELTDYLSNAGIEVEGILAAYHMAGASFLPGVPVYATASADRYGHEGGGRALIDNFTGAFGDAFDGSIAAVTDVLEAGPTEIAGIAVNILPNDEAFDIEIPALNAVYVHMLGHDCHSIVAGPAHADAIIAQLESFLSRGFDLVLTSHYTPEDQKDVRTKIAYLENLKTLAAEAENATAFKAAVQEAYPAYAGENYLELTTGYFYPEA